MESIFESVVRRENDHTNLLRNILDRYPNAASVILTYLLGAKELSWDASQYEYTKQSRFETDQGIGIPDIHIEGPGFRCLIEVKVSPLPFTKAQREGYAACFNLGAENHLCYLVPKGRKDFPGKGADWEGDDGTKIHYRDWSGLIQVLLAELELRPDAILLEAAKFWEQTFAFWRMTLANKSFLTTWNGDNYIAMRKLQRTVDQARKLFEVNKFEIEPGVKDITDYGFYLKRGKHYELWVGIWAKLDSPLLFGFEKGSPTWRNPSPLPTPDLSEKKIRPLAIRTRNVGRSHQALRNG